MTLTSVPVSSVWIMALFAGVTIATLTLFALVILAWRERPREKGAKLYTLHQRPANVTEAPPVEYRKSA